MLVAELLAAPAVLFVALRWLPRTRIGQQLILSGPATAGHAAAADEELVGLLGQQGVAATPLRPAGVARIGARRIDVITQGEMLDAGTTLRVVDVSGNRVVVCKSPSTKPNES